MTASVSMSIQATSGGKRLPLSCRKPQRISIAIPHAVYEELVKISFKDGRSMSNLASFLLEQGIQNFK
jgi:hypothetical protein